MIDRVYTKTDAFPVGRHQRDLLSDDQWHAGDRYFTEIFSVGGEKLSEERWRALEYGFDAAFWAHLGAALQFSRGS